MRLGVSTKPLYTWIAQFSKPQFSKPQFPKPQWQTDQEAEVRRLKKELARVMELPRSHSSLLGRRRCQITSRLIHFKCQFLSDFT